MRIKSWIALEAIAASLLAAASLDCQALTKPDYPVVFIHGLGGSADATWADLKAFLVAQEWRFGGSPRFDPVSKQVSAVSAGDFYTMNMSDSKALTLREQGYELSAVVEKILSSNPGKTKVYLVGHSMGGLASRSYLQGMAKRGTASAPYLGDVVKLITICTPHQGAELATMTAVFGSSSVAINELQASSAALLELNDLRSSPLPSGVSYVSIIGTGLQTLFVPGLFGDGIVSQEAQNLGRLAGAVVLNHVAKEFAAQSRTGCDPLFNTVNQGFIGHMCATSDPGVWAELIQQIRPSIVSVTITDPPQSQTVIVGSSVTFSVRATGPAPLTYQWRKDGVNLPIGTNTSFAIADVQPDSAGAYSVTVSNADGSVTSSNASLTVVVPPLRIREVGRWREFGSAYGVAISGDLAYVEDRFTGLQIIDVSNPSRPIRVGNYDSSGPYAWGIAVSSNRAYVAAGEAGLQVIDATNPARPTLLGRYNFSLKGPALDVAVTGDFAYVAAGAAGFQVIDVSNPANLVRVGSVRANWPSGVAIAGNYAYVADNGFGLIVIDVTDPINPVLVGSHATDGVSTFGVALSGNHAYVADGNAGLKVVDVSNPQRPVRVGGYNIGGEAYNVVLSGSYAYVAAGFAGLQAIDVSDPTRPILADAARGLAANDVKVAGGYAYVASDFDGLIIFQIIQSSAPPSLSNQPINQTTAVGGTATFSASAEGSPPLRFQWRFNNSSLPGRTNATLTLTSVATNQAGFYSVLVSNAFGVAASTNASLTVVVGPQNQTVVKRGNAVFSATVVSPVPVSYQWRKDGVRIASATNASYAISAAELNHAGNYMVNIAASDGSSSSFTASLVVVSVLRRLPSGYWPGVPITVEIETAPGVGITSHTVTERLPRDVTWELLPTFFNADGTTIAYRQGSQFVRVRAMSINEEGVFDPATSTLKWGPFFDDAPRVLRYSLVSPLGWKSFFTEVGGIVIGPDGKVDTASGWKDSIPLNGDLSEDGRSTALPQDTVRLYPLHPADNSPPANNFINIFELSAYAAAWRRSLLWPVPPGTIKDDYLTQAGAIWKRGEYYENVGGTPPLNWQSAPLPPDIRRSSQAAVSSSRVPTMSLASAASGTAARSVSSAQLNPRGPRVDSG